MSRPGRTRRTEHRAERNGCRSAASAWAWRGVAVRSGAALPDISNAEAVKRAVLKAESLVFNRASTGHYFEAVLNKMGLHAQALPNSTRYADGASVMEHVLHGQGRGIGFGAITEIVLLRDKGLQLWLRCRWSCRTSPPTPRRP